MSSSQNETASKCQNLTTSLAKTVRGADTTSQNALWRWGQCYQPCMQQQLDDRAANGFRPPVSLAPIPKSSCGSSCWQFVPDPPARGCITQVQAAHMDRSFWVAILCSSRTHACTRSPTVTITRAIRRQQLGRTAAHAGVVSYHCDTSRKTSHCHR